MISESTRWNLKDQLTKRKLFIELLECKVNKVTAQVQRLSHHSVRQERQLLLSEEEEEEESKPSARLQISAWSEKTKKSRHRKQPNLPKMVLIASSSIWSPVISLMLRTICSLVIFFSCTSCHAISTTASTQRQAC